MWRTPLVRLSAGLGLADPAVARGPLRLRASGRRPSGPSGARFDHPFALPE